MSLSREALSTTDFSEFVSGIDKSGIHPGEILIEEFLKPMNLSVYALAKQINIPRSRANDIARGKRAITVDTALRFSRFFGTSAEFWLNLQSNHDLDVGRKNLEAKIEKEIEPHGV